MKRVISKQLAVISLIGVIGLIGLTGCKTTPTGADTARVNRLTGLARSAAYMGTRFALLSNPEYRPAFVAADTTLSNLIATEDYDPLKFALALQSLNIRELKGAQGTLIVEGAVLLYDQVMQLTTTIDKKLIVGQVMGAVREGMHWGLYPEEMLNPPGTTPGTNAPAGTVPANPYGASTTLIQ